MIDFPLSHSFSLLNNFPLIQGYFERSIGSMSQKDKAYSHTIQNVTKILHIKTEGLKLMKQCHGNTVIQVSKSSAILTEKADGLVTDTNKIILGVKTADCLPIIFYDPVKKIIGTCHAGYKGLLNSIIQNTLATMQQRGTVIKDILVGVGPSICGSCYTVDRERINLFKYKFPKITNFYRNESTHYLLDLRLVACKIMNDSGIKRMNIEFSPFCTKENNAIFFSRRVETSGVFLTVVGML